MPNRWAARSETPLVMKVTSSFQTENCMLSSLSGGLFSIGALSMQASSALHAFQDFLTAAGLSLDTLTPGQATDSMIQFYKQLRADACDFESDADMLLFQWGVYDWGAGEFFEYNITRQLIYPETIPADAALPDDGDGEEEIFGQLSLTLKYAPTSELRAIPSGNRWCHDLADLSTFTTFIVDCEATKRVQHHAIVARELHFENAE
jgi:hypothetical protein